MALQNAFANLALDASVASLKVTDPDGTQDVSANASTLFLDSFDVSLANFATGGTAGTQASSAYTFASNTTASTVSTLRTNAQFTLRAMSYLRFAQYVKFESAAVTNTTRFWGVGTLQNSPTAAAPVLNGAVFQLDYADGALYAVIYNNGTGTKQGTALTRPTDAGTHRYDIWYRQNVIYWLIDGVTVKTVTMPTISVWQLPYWISGQINYTTAPSAAPQLVVAGVSVTDTGGNNKTLSDGANPYIQQSVKPASTAPVATDAASVVALHPYSTATIIGSQTLTATAAANTAVTVTLPAPATGLRHYVTSITFEQFATTTLTAAATPIVSTASNHNLVTSFMQAAAAAGSISKDFRSFTSGLASLSTATATSFTLPATANIIWRLTVSYYVAP